MKQLRVGITHGDINGIGPELILKLFSGTDLHELCTPVIFSGSSIMNYVNQCINLEHHVSFHTISKASEALDGRLNLVDVCQENSEVLFGEQTENSLQAEAASLQAALQAWQNREIDVLVCCPGQLDNDQDHHALSDFVRRAVEGLDGDFDFICNGPIRTLQLHKSESSTQTGEALLREHFVEELRKVYYLLRQDFSFIRPRMALVSADASLHEQVKELREHGVTLFGPFPATEFLEKQMHQHYDGILFLDQEEGRHQLLSSLDAGHTYGFVGGLPLVLTTTMQPVSYDIAGKGAADERPLRNALYAAIDIYRSRITYQRATRRPLEKQWNPKGRDDFKLDLTKEEE